MLDNTKIALFNLGFRPFFLAASLFSIVSVILWTLFYSYGWGGQPVIMTVAQWHAHEMVFGYAMAVVAGFLLTAVRNWTGVSTISGFPLALLLAVWILARVIPFTGAGLPLIYMAILDNLFIAGLIIALSIPIFKARQWKQVGILSKLLFIFISNILFYAGLGGYLEEGIRWGLYGGFYLILALVFMMARRVIPFFIEKGLGGTVRVSNSRLLDIGSLVIFLIFIIADIAQPNGLFTMILALTLFLMHSFRLYGWYCNGIWRVPMLWILYIAYCFLVLGFALKAAVWWFGISPFLSLHAFSYGGIGLITLGMMARIALGHTGRDISQPPAVMPWAFLILITGSFFRVILPLIDPERYYLWVKIAQFCWITAFTLFIFSYTSILLKPRIDGQEG
ncbi:MAG: NnrS family protein [Gammaproteobacteria bacterium]|nr:NnrS family protein [Gammaproteobacteria bacterium]